MALPTLPAQGQNPWFTERNAWDTAVGSRIDGLTNVDNTSDANKPISTATQAALDAKASLTVVDGMYQYDTYANRPPATSVRAGTRFYAYDVSEEYSSNGSVWSVVGQGGSELGYAEVLNSFTNATTTPQVVPGLTTTFRVGERPIAVDLRMRMATGGAGSLAWARVRLDGTEIFRVEQNSSSAGTWASMAGGRRVSGLVPGTIHTVDVTFSLGTGATGNALTAGDATNPNNLLVRTT